MSTLNAKSIKGKSIIREIKPRLEESDELVRKYISIREKSGITQKELGNFSQFKQSAIARIENLRVTPRIDTLIRILKPLGYTIDIVPIDETRN